MQFDPAGGLQLPQQFVNTATPRSNERLTGEQSLARASGDAAAVARATRDLTYWQARLASAQLTEPPFSSQVQFGSRVTIARGKSAPKTYRIVGTDEADPSNGTLSYVSPLSQALMERRPAIPS